MVNRIIPIVILATFLLTQASAKERTRSDFLEGHVGKTISLIGKYSQFGKVAAFVLSPKAAAEPIYLLNVKKTFPEGTILKVIGHLHHYDPPKHGLHDDDDSYAKAHPYYYFDGSDLQLCQSKQ
jgi:hypothetical protein